MTTINLTTDIYLRYRNNIIEYSSNNNFTNTSSISNWPVTLNNSNVLTTKNVYITEKLVMNNINNNMGPNFNTTISGNTTTYTFQTDYRFGTTIGSANVTAQIQAAGLGNTAQDFIGFVPGRIALVQRGIEFFQTKVDNAIAAGASAVIIYNNTSGIITPGLQTNIPVIFITQAIGNQLVANLVSGTVTSNINSVFPQNYFIMGTSNITIDGQNNIVEINNISYYDGLVQNGTSGLNGKDNIIIKNVGVSAIGSSSLNDNAGWIGQQYFNKGAMGCIVDTCYSTGIISGTYAGGICGYGSSGTITNCYSSGMVSGERSGGICGANSSGTITNCYSTGAISGPSSGGICGNGSSGTVSNCYSAGVISGLYAGGICGYGSSGTVTNCYSSGMINSTFSGGIYGYGSNGAATNCYSTGTISGNQAGGIFGQSSSGTATNCYSSGTISGAFSGGIYSFVSSGTATNCYSTGAISGFMAGGIFGASSSGAAINCYSSGMITGSSAGGIYTDDSSGTATNCYIANGNWNDLQAVASGKLINGPIYATGGQFISQGTIWIDIDTINANVPFQLKSFNSFTDFSLSPLSVNEGIIYYGSLTSNSATSTQYRIISQQIENNLYISGNNLIARYPFNYYSTPIYRIMIEGTSSGVTITKEFTISIIDVPQAPTSIDIINGIGKNIPEDTPIKTFLGDLYTFDPDQSNYFTYQFVTGTGSMDNTLFTLENGKLYTNTLFNYRNKNSYSIRLKSTDNTNLSVECILILNVIIPYSPDSQITTLIGRDKSIVLNGMPVSGKKLTYRIVIPPKNGLLTGVLLSDKYTYRANKNGTDLFTYVIYEGTMVSQPIRVAIYNFSQTDVSTISRNQGTFTFDNISFDGDTWRFGTFTTDTFIQNGNYNKMGNFEFYKI